MPDYQNGKIYTIRCRTDETLIYVGSTIQPLSVRIGEHKRTYKNEKYNDTLLYKTINNNWDEWYIELYEEYPCENKEQLCKKEGEIIREIGTLNSQIAGRKAKEWYIDNKDKYLKIHKEYREQNKDIISKKARELITCECGCMVRKNVITTHKKTQKHLKLLDAINTS